MEKLIGQATEEQIAKWKKEYKGGIYGVKVGGHIAYFRRPNRRDINVAASQLDNENPMNYYEDVMRETFLGGSEEVISNDRLYLGAIQQVKTQIEGEKAELVNL